MDNSVFNYITQKWENNTRLLIETIENEIKFWSTDSHFKDSPFLHPIEQRELKVRSLENYLQKVVNFYGPID